MSYCPTCGAATNPGATFCHACGGALTAAIAPVALPGAPAAAHGMPGAQQTRPIGVTIVGIVTVVFGAVAIFAGFAVMLFMGALGAFAGMFFPFGGEFGAFFGVLGLIAAMFVFGFAALMIVTGIGTLRGRSWAWILMIVLMALNGVRGMLALAQRDAGSIVTIAVSGLVIWYFLRPEVKAWFGRA